jgi:hypothetical protein
MKFEAEIISEYKMKLFTGIRESLKNILNFRDN